MPICLRVPREWLEAQIDNSLGAYDAMRTMPTVTDADRAALLGAFRTWDERNRRLLEQSFEPVAWHESSPKSEYSVLEEMTFKLLEELSTDRAPVLGRVADEKARKLRSIRDSLELYEATAVPPRAANEAPDSDSSLTIFLVHGRDVAAREVVRRLLERVTGVPVVVLVMRPRRVRQLSRSWTFDSMRRRSSWRFSQGTMRDA